MTMTQIVEDPIRTSRPVPWGGVIARVRASERARRFVPTELALIGTDLLSELSLLVSKGRRTVARSGMEAVVGGTTADNAIPRRARRQVTAQARGWELTFRPWELAATPIEGLERLDAARATGRGVLISYNHMGPFMALVPLAEHCRPLYTAVGEWLLESPRPGYNGYQLEQRRKVLVDAGFEMLRAQNSARQLITLLKARETVLLGMDLPGRTSTQFLGKPVEMADGTARLSKMTDSLIVPVAILPRGRKWFIDVDEAVDPRDYASAADLHQAVASIHERLILLAPEHLENPLREGGWARATRSGWHVA